MSKILMPFSRKVSKPEMERCQNAAVKELEEFVEALQKKYNVSVFPTAAPTQYKINIIHNQRFETQSPNK